MFGEYEDSSGSCRGVCVDALLLAIGSDGTGIFGNVATLFVVSSVSSVIIIKGTLA